MGRRYSVNKGGGATVTRHFWDGDEITYDSVTTNGTTTGYNYLHGAYTEGTIVGATLYGNILNIHGDVTGTYQGTTKVNAAQFDAFGRVSSSSGTFRNPYGYSGEYTDATGLQYLRARYYNPELGRFTQQDTWRDQGNPYVYCSNNPVAYTDPSGHCKRYGIPDVKTSILMIPDEWYMFETISGCDYERVDLPYGNAPFYSVTMKEGSDLCAEWIAHRNMAMREKGIDNIGPLESAAIWVTNNIISPALDIIDRIWPNNQTYYEPTSNIINNQNNPSIKNISFGVGNIGKNGCGAVAAYNVIVSMSSYGQASLQGIRDDLIDRGGLVANGRLGTNPFVLADYMRTKFHTVMTAGPDTSSWGTIATQSEAVIIFILWNNMSAMHFIAGIPTGRNGVFKFYNSGLKDEKGNTINGIPMTMDDFLYYLEFGQKTATPVYLIGMSDKKGIW